MGRMSNCSVQGIYGIIAFENHPPRLVADLNRKVVFRYQAGDGALPEEDEENTDYVNCVNFWGMVT